MKILWLLVSFTFTLYATSILVINSNAKIDRYQTMENTFSKAIAQKVQHVDIASMNKNDIKEYLYDIYPDVVYAIGTKAYQYAKKYIPEKKIFFSSIVNYKRLKMGKNIFGVSNELHAGMKLTLIKSLLNQTKTISMIYSRYTKDIYESFKKEASYVGIKIIAQEIDGDETFDSLKLQSADAFVLIADPLLLKDEERVEALFSSLKKADKPLIAYHPLYIKYGAVLVISIDIPTVGRQVASMIHSDMSGQDIVPIQAPVGTKVIFNENLAKRINLHYNSSALSTVNRVIK